MATQLAARRWWMIMPIVFITYSLAYLDRANYGFAAAAGINHDLGISQGLSSLIGALFFLGYFFFQIPGAIYAERRSVKKLVFISLVLWGLCAALTGGGGGADNDWTVSGNDMHSSVSGNVGIGVTSPSEKLEVNGNVKATDFLYSSDRRLKKNIKPAKGLEVINRLNGVSFEWKDSGEKSVGVIAQDVEKVLPELVKTDKKSGLKSVMYGNLIAPVIESIKELYQMLIDVKNSVAELFEKDAKLQQQIELQNNQIKEMKRALELQSRQIQKLQQSLASPDKK